MDSVEQVLRAGSAFLARASAEHGQGMDELVRHLTARLGAHEVPAGHAPPATEAAAGDPGPRGAQQARAGQRQYAASCPQPGMTPDRLYHAAPCLARSRYLPGLSRRYLDHVYKRP